ncbi:uncharacterized protein FA14DRAFT_170680 [Meira miltonrushii]|uniref:Uncharacterized protein n=1 Tax=Meira miltonrushii TaxID=1280837 RepID=A0A316VJQ6_9BASI|nr:uncharacterized protein FA14DRAFT_170680 [Meira miltonrushii]PWN37917.1 hypothetical protein FA14DRAFT_170680 [Meira miltonrushii]
MRPSFTLSFVLALALVVLTISDSLVSAVPVPGKIYRGSNTPRPVSGGFRTQDALTKPGKNPSDPLKAADPKFKKDDQGNNLKDSKGNNINDKVQGDTNIPAQQGTCVGLSCNTDPAKASKGKTHWIDTDDPATQQKLKDANLVATPDGDQPGRDPGHVSIQSTKDMPAKELQDGINGLGWKPTEKKRRATW